MGIIEGRCLCGAIRYRINGTPSWSIICHCRSCRLASAAPSVGWLTVARADFTVLSGEPRRFASSPGVLRGFCGDCGSPLTYQNDRSPGTVDITTATLDDPTRFPPTHEVWLEHRLPWEADNPQLVACPRDSST
jgi:hypothetical protein